MMRTLGKYRFLRMLGRGGMGEVYLAEHTLLKVKRAVKVLPEAVASTREFQHQFVTEARILAALRHPNIVQIHDADEIDGRYYIAMDFVSPDGESSLSGAELLHARGGMLPPEDAARVLVQVCGAIEYAHELGVIHRDIKPANLLMDAQDTVHVSDFGLAKMVGEDFLKLSMMSQMSHGDNPTATPWGRGPDVVGMSSGDNPTVGPQGHEQRVNLTSGDAPTAGHTPAAASASRSTSEGIVGTFHFMPPEVHAGEPWTKQGDIYSFGVLAYVLLTGRPPVGAYRLPHALDDRISPLWDDLIERALQPGPEDRFEGFGSVRDELLYLYPQLEQGVARGSTGGAAQGELPASAARMVKEFVRQRGAEWSREDWHAFMIQFYRHPGHDPIEPDAVENLASQERSLWLERDARQREEQARRAEEADRRRREAEAARARLELDRKVTALCAEAEQAFGEERFEDARSLWQEVLKLKPDHRRALQAAQEAAARQAERLGKAGAEAFARKDYSGAVRNWQEALESSPQNPELERRIAQARDLMKREAERRRKLAEALDSARGNIDKDMRQALAACDVYLELEPGNPGVIGLKQRAETALAEHERLVALAQESFTRRRYEKAIQFYEQARDIATLDPRSAENLAAAKGEVGRKRERSRRFYRGLEKRSGYVGAVVGLTAGASCLLASSWGKYIAAPMVVVLGGALVAKIVGSFADMAAEMKADTGRTRQGTFYKALDNRSERLGKLLGLFAGVVFQFAVLAVWGMALESGYLPTPDRLFSTEGNNALGYVFAFVLALFIGFVLWWLPGFLMYLLVKKLVKNRLARLAAKHE
ncbi:MAG: protein kinase [Candidatus Hydrogenedentes bacterium]|nr:protein kinase [Candidatus Hydrogenedentota bacterium]